jgi:AraC-like DNA-binding protein
MSISSLNVKFKTQHGKSVKGFFIEKKMDYTRELLKQGKRIKEVAAILGCKAPLSF